MAQTPQGILVTTNLALSLHLGQPILDSVGGKGAQDEGSLWGEGPEPLAEA